MTARFYCTYFDHNYLPRGLALYRSLMRHAPGSLLWVLCLSDECHEILGRMALPNLHRISMAEFEKDDEELRDAKTNRSRVEYFFTCTASLPLYVMKHHEEVDLITYLDSDLFFYSDPESIFDEIGGHSIVIIDHRFPPELRERCSATGRYNVGWVTFRRDKQGLACLHWWRERTLEWCHDWVDGDRFADQKYLEKFPVLFKNLLDLQHKGANTAPYNIANYKVRIEGEKVWIDEYPLVFFHFHGFNQISPRVFDPYFHNYNVELTPELREGIVRPYAQAYSAALDEARRYLDQSGVSFATRGHSRRISLRHPLKFLYNNWLIRQDRRKHLRKGDYLLLKD